MLKSITSIELIKAIVQIEFDFIVLMLLKKEVFIKKGRSNNEGKCKTSES